MFFHFQLHPIAEILPWGGKGQTPVLHWFGLSDGRYWMQIGEAEVFRLNEMILAADHPDRAPHPLNHYVNYYVVRLWEDILEIVPDVVDPLPPAILERMQSIDTWLQWCQKVEHWQDDEQELRSEEVHDARRDLHKEALSWWWSRHLYTGPILFGPGMHFWSDGQCVHCLWDSRGSLSKDGIPLWDAVYGTASMPMATFMEAVTSFNTRFISAMAERVEIVLADWSRPEIKIDFDYLAREHVQRSEHFAKRMGEVPTRAKTPAQWQRTLEAIQAIENDPDFIVIP